MILMKELINELIRLKDSNIRSVVNERLDEFNEFQNKSNEEWFSELCFCILTANSKARTALNVQEDLGVEGFCNACADEVKECIKRNKHRFHNNKTNYIINAREHLNIKDDVELVISEGGLKAAREWLKLNIKGLGFKEASHFLRNVGYDELAIIDRHVLRVLHEYGLIDEIPSYLNKSKYLQIEAVLETVAKRVNMKLSELDLYLWYLKTGEVLK